MSEVANGCGPRYEDDRVFNTTVLFETELWTDSAELWIDSASERWRDSPDCGKNRTISDRLGFSPREQ